MHHETGGSEILPTRLDWSTPLNPRFALVSHWPPWHFRTCEVTDALVRARYLDAEIDDEPAILPFGFDKEAVWEAVHDRRRRVWHVRFVMLVDEFLRAEGAAAAPSPQIGGPDAE